jgi:serine/threonine protein kinase
MGAARGIFPCVGDQYPRAYADYVLLERLGAGGMSEVDLARKVVDDPNYVRFSVIKRIKTDRVADESFVRMFKDEARITSELHHANIGTVYDFGKVGDEYYLALEYVPGIDCRHLINTLRERGQRVPLKVALKIVCDVLDALQYAHEKRDTFGRPMNIVHRDVNPRNIMISIRGEVKLIDFGVAKATDRLERTRTDHVKGKFSYMAPEQISGAHTDHRADLFAIGLTLHELLSGVSPFHGLNQIQILHRMVAGTAPDLPQVPELPDLTLLSQVQAKALTQAPSDRFQSASDYATALRRVAQSVGGLPTPAQLAAFLHAVDPILVARLQHKMETYASLEITNTGEVTSPVALDERGGGLVGEVPPEVRTATDASFHGTLAPETESLTVTRTGLLAGSFLLVSAVSAVVASLIVTGLLLGAWYAFGPPVAVAPQPAPVAPVQPVVPVEVPAVVAPPPPEPVVAEPEPPRPRPVKPKSVKPKPAPEPVPEPEPVAVAPAPEPAPAPPAPTGAGFLNINAPAPTMVLLNGQESGRLTPVKRMEVPLGSYKIEVSGYACSPSRVDLDTNGEAKNVICR